MYQPTILDNLKNIKHDLPASVVLFFVALPLCLGIALASGAPLFSGIIAGIVGGIVVGSFSGSQIGASGPAAGLTAIVLSAIATLGNWETFLLATVMAGLIQLLIGFIGGGIIAYYFPSSVIKGMLAGIGIIIIMKQIMYALGCDTNLEGDLTFQQVQQQYPLVGWLSFLCSVNPGAVLITAVSMFILIFWEKVLAKKHRIFQVIQGPLVAVFVGILFNWLYQKGMLGFRLDAKDVVNIPVASTLQDFFKQFHFPDFSQFTNINVYKIALIIAVVASVETLLCVEAADKLDPQQRVTPTNRELKAQGIGNIVSGLLGGLPVSQVIVRSSANINFGARSKMSTIFHGLFLLICAITIPGLLNMIPLATLASILLVVGYKLANPALFKQIYKLGWEQFVPFIATVIGMVFTDLLVGVGIGIAIAIFVILRNNYNNPYYILKNGHKEGGEYIIHLAQEVSFLNKGSILQELNNLPPKSTVIIDGSNSKIIDYDVIEIIQNFLNSAKTKGIKVELKGVK